mmetsp:Transcript_31639/g.80698  ORF Transcript_31639/g.80698 Transcript_31639/m.80698 type:complete len:244 (-) Transcript_31639:154-885(-)
MVTMLNDREGLVFQREVCVIHGEEDDVPILHALLQKKLGQVNLALRSFHAPVMRSQGTAWVCWNSNDEGVRDVCVQQFLAAPFLPPMHSVVEVCRAGREPDEDLWRGLRAVRMRPGAHQQCLCLGPVLQRVCLGLHQRSPADLGVRNGHLLDVPNRRQLDRKLGMQRIWLNRQLHWRLGRLGRLHADQLALHGGLYAPFHAHLPDAFVQVRQAALNALQLYLLAHALHIGLDACQLGFDTLGR